MFNALRPGHTPCSHPAQDAGGAAAVDPDDPYAHCLSSGLPSSSASPAWPTPTAVGPPDPTASPGFATPACADGASAGFAGVTPGSGGPHAPFATRETAGECLAFLQASLEAAGVAARLPDAPAAAADPHAALAAALTAVYELLRLLQRSNEQRERQDALIGKLRVEARTADRAAQRMAGASEQQGQEAAGLKIKVRPRARGGSLRSCGNTQPAVGPAPRQTRPPLQQHGAEAGGQHEPLFAACLPRPSPEHSTAAP
jgi:hypothetical protein